VPAGTRPW